RHSRKAGMLTRLAVDTVKEAKATLQDWPDRKALEDYVNRCEGGCLKVRFKGQLDQLGNGPRAQSIEAVAAAAAFARNATKAADVSASVAAIATVDGREDPVLHDFATKMDGVSKGKFDITDSELTRLLDLGATLAKVKPPEFDRARILDEVSKQQ